MQLTPPTLSTLFEQLGLAADQASIDAFIRQNALGHDVKMVDAPFWTPVQAQLLKQELLEDAEWAPVVDELNLLLHPDN